MGKSRHIKRHDGGATSYVIHCCCVSMLIMDDLEQKCHDLETKVRRLEEERNETMAENDDLQEQVSLEM